MLGNQTFEHVDLSLQDIKATIKVFGDISLLLSGDLLQLPPVQQQQIFMKHKKGSYKAFQGSLWEEFFRLYELTDIVRQSSDPEFADILSRVHEGNHTDTSNWQEKAVS